MRWLLGTLVLLTASPALAFEGEIDAKSIGGGPQGSVVMQIFVAATGDVRIDTKAKGPDGKTYRSSYITPKKGKYNYALDHDRKQATKIEKAAVAKLAKDSGGSGKDTRADIEVKKLGTEKVAGQNTRHIRITDKVDGTTADLWLSDRYPAKLWLNVFAMGGQEDSPGGQWATVMKREYGVEPGFIMKALSTSKGTKAGLEVTRIQKKKVPANKFTVPSSYKTSSGPDVAGMPSDMKMPTTPEEAEKMREEWMKKMQQQQR